MANLSTMTIHLGLDTKQMETGATNAQGLLNKLGNTPMTSTLGGVAALGGAFGGMAAIATKAVDGIMSSINALRQNLSNSFRDIDLLSKQSASMGFELPDFQAFRMGAEMSGVATEQFAAGTAKLTKLLAEAKAGSERAVAVFRELGVSGESLRNMGPAEAMREIADGFASIEDPAKRVQLSMQLFGESGARMVNFLAQGSEAMDRAKQVAEEYGFALSSVDAAKIEEANDAWTLMTATLGGLWDQLAVALAPAFEQLALEAADFAKHLIEGIKVAAPAITELTVRFARFAGDIMEKVQPAIDAMIWSMEKAAEAAEWFGFATVGPSKDIKDIFGGGADHAKELAGAIDESAAAMTAMGAAIPEIDKEFEKLKQRADQLTQSFRSPAEVYADARNELEKMLELGLITGEVFAKGLEKGTNELLKANKAMDSLKQSATSGVGAAERYSMAGFSAVQAGMRAQQDQQRAADEAKAQREKQIALLEDANNLARERKEVVVKEVSL